MRVTLKLATSLDGKIATSTGESQWITSVESRRQVHLLRSRHDGVLAGIGTILADNPQLNVRGSDDNFTNQPDRIILDTHLRTPENARVFDEKHGRVIIVSGQIASDTASRCLTTAGAEIVALPLNGDKNPSPLAVLQSLEEKGIESVFIEGGGQVAASFLKSGLVDRLEWFRAGIVIGNDGIPALSNLGITALSAAFRFKRLKVTEIGPDIWETYERE